MNYIRKHFITFLELILLLTTVVYSFQHYNAARIEGNAASRALLALGPILNIGIPYKELYEFVPPGFLVIFSSWVKTFGLSMLSFRAFNLFFTLLSGIFLLAICKKLFLRRTIEFFIYFSVLISIHSGIIQTDVFSIDFFATTLVLGGLVTLLYLKHPIMKLAASSTLILAASQIKDIYLLPALALIPIYLRELINRSEKSFYKLFFLSIAMPLGLALLIIGYLFSIGAVKGYINVLRDKAAFAHFKPPGEIINNFIFMIQIFEKNFLNFPLLITGLVILAFGLFILIYLRKVNKIKLKPLGWLNDYGETYQGEIALTLVYIASLLFGITIYGQYSVDARFSAIVSSLFILLGLLITYLSNITDNFFKAKNLRIMAITVLIILIIPKPNIFMSYDFHSLYNGNYDFSLEKEIIARTNKDDCILHVYGWGVSMTYIYTQRRPCTKYFLPNSLQQVERHSMVREYRQEIFNALPSVVIYSTGGADLNIKRFEEEVMNLPQILKKCYSPDPKYKNYKNYFLAPVTIYWPKSQHKEDLRECFIKYGQPKRDS